jgi:predicted CXXCH cytochrome family protein
MMKDEPNGSNHDPFKGGECLTCHDSHASNTAGMLVKPQLQVCGGCHEPYKGLKEAASKHAPFSEGNCSMCHNPHKAKLKNLLVTQGPGLCYSCHKDIKDKMEKQKPHNPAQQDCLNCHKPHYAAAASLLAAKVTTTCEQCHEATKAPFVKAHLGIEASVMNCMSCHDPHASKDPKFFKDSIHAPFAARACEECHTVAKP